MSYLAMYTLNRLLRKSLALIMIDRTEDKIQNKIPLTQVSYKKDVVL